MATPTRQQLKQRRRRREESARPELKCTGHSVCILYLDRLAPVEQPGTLYHHAISHLERLSGGVYIRRIIKLAN
jgi:hypothetical protein